MNCQETRTKQQGKDHFRQRCGSRAISIRIKSIIYEPVVSGFLVLPGLSPPTFPVVSPFLHYSFLFFFLFHLRVLPLFHLPLFPSRLEPVFLTPSHRLPQSFVIHYLIWTASPFPWRLSRERLSQPITLFSYVHFLTSALRIIFIHIFYIYILHYVAVYLNCIKGSASLSDGSRSVTLSGRLPLACSPLCEISHSRYTLHHYI